MLQAKEAAVSTPDQSVAMGLPEAEFGIIYAVKGGEQFTLVGDPDFARFLLETPANLLAEVTIPEFKFPLIRPGW